MEKYYLFIIILLILLVGYLLYSKNKKDSETKPEPKIIYVQKKGLYGDSNPIPKPVIIANPIRPNNKIGILTSVSPNPQGVLNLYAIILDSWREIYSYYVEDKNGFKIPLLDKYNYKFVNGDIIEDIPSNPGKWKVLLY